MQPGFISRFPTFMKPSKNFIQYNWWRYTAGLINIDLKYEHALSIHRYMYLSGCIETAFFYYA